MGIKQFRNVRPASSSTIEVTFIYQGQRQRERLKLKPTTDNLEKAFSWLKQIEQAIEGGYFDYAKSFPNSKRARLYINQKTLESWMNTWIYKQSHLKQSTFNEYKKFINGQLGCIADLRIEDLQWKHIKEWILAKDISSKTRTNYLSILRASLHDAVEDEQISSNPMLGRRLKQQTVEVSKRSDEIDPFSWEERESIKNAADGQFKLMIVFGFWTGLRISELIALDWKKVNWERKTIKIDQVLTQTSKSFEVPKTKRSIREVELHKPAYDALQEMKSYTYLEGGIVFRNPYNGLPWDGDSSLRKRWKRILKKADVRYRSPKQMRHTYISTGLMEGEDVGFICEQVGHDNEMVTFKNYNRYIKNNRAERGSKIEKAWRKNTL